MEQSICGRFAPSPSGRMHLGNVFCALIAWLSAKSQNGHMLLRIEDLDISRSKPEYIQCLLEDLAFLGLTYDEGGEIGGLHGPYKQSERTAIYEEYLQILKDKDLVYPCYCSRDELHAPNAPHASDGRVLYSGRCRSMTAQECEKQKRSPSFRVKAASTPISFSDGHYGTQTMNVQAEWGDFVVRRSDGLFAYQLAVVVDDALMGVTQVVRGRDLLTSVAPQLQLYEELGLAAPSFYHIPMLLSADGRRLSKRDKDLDMGELRKCYATPEALIGKLLYAAGLLEKEESLTAIEAIEVFDWDKIRHEDIKIDTEFF